jgi:predicted MFS family arabinose efflux permease
MTSPTGLYWNLGLLTGIALSGTSYVVVLGAAARAVPAERRGSAFGLITAAGSFGMFSMVPLVQWQISGWGWQTAFLISAGFVALIGLLAIGLPGRSSDPFNRNAVADPNSMPVFSMLKRARCHSGYLLLITGFFVCGFHVAFISTHLPAYLSDKGVPAMAGAAALSMIGLFNIFGSYLFGFLGDRYRKKHLLSLLYLLRAAVIVLFLALPLSEISAIIFGSAIGFLWLATVPLTSGIVAQIFGPRYLSTFYGIVFFSHQIGSFLGVWLGGRLYDLSQSYTAVWLVAVVLGLLAAVVHLPISDRRVEETAACKLLPVTGT